MTWRTFFLPIFAAVLVFLATAPGGNVAWAQDKPSEGTVSTAEPKSTDANGQPINCRSIKEAKGGVLLGTIIPCMVYSIQSGTQKFSAKMVEIFRPLLYTFLTLVIVLFGVRIVQGEPEIHKHGIILLLKITIVLTVLDNIPNYYVPKAYAIMNDAQTIVTGAIDDNTGSYQCEQKPTSDNQPGKPYGDENTPRLWSMMDCVMGKLFGYANGNATSSNGPNMMLATSMFGLIAGFFFGGTWAVVICFAMLGVMFSICLLVIRTVMAFLNGYLTVCLMLILCPLLMPLVFMKQTQQYFEGVIKNILGGFLMPIIITAYAMFALLLYDKMLFAQDSIVQNLFNYDKIKEALEQPRKACTRPITGDPIASRFQSKTQDQSDVSKDDANKAFLSPLLKNMMVPSASGANDPCVKARFPALNTNQIEDLNKGREGFQKMFNELLTLFILAYLIHAGLKSVTAMIAMLTGARSAAAGFEASMKNELKIEEAGRAAFQQANSAYGGASGKEFLERTPTAAKDGLNAFFSGIRR